MQRPIGRRLGLLVLSLSIMGSAPAAALTDSLWGRAVDMARIASDWVPRNAAVTIELVGSDGKAQDSWSSEYRLSADATGQVAIHVERSSHNGIDTTARDRDTQSRRPRQPFTMGDNPFDPVVQASLHAVPRPEGQVVQGRLCSLYDFTLTRKDGSTVVGTAWLDAASAEPVQVSYTAKPLPRGVFEMRTTLLYGQGPAGSGFLTEARIEGVGGMLFIRRSFRSRITIEGYWRKPIAAVP